MEKCSIRNNLKTTNTENVYCLVYCVPNILQMCLKIHAGLITLKLHCVWWFVNMQLTGHNNYVRAHQIPYSLSNNLERETNLEILILFLSVKHLIKSIFMLHY